MSKIITSNIHLTLISTPQDFQILDILIRGNGMADPKDLVHIQLPEGIDPHKGVILNGRAPFWLYVLLAQQCQHTAWIALMDPRYGAIVVAVHQKDSPSIGSVIQLELFQTYLPIHTQDNPPGSIISSAFTNRVIAFVGPPHSGKSVLIHAIYKELQRWMTVEEFQRDLFLFRACPDGEGNWSSEIPHELAQTLRYKNYFDKDFIDQVCQKLETLIKTKRIILADLGGKIQRSTQQILNCCTHALIISRDPGAVYEWRGAIQASGVQVLAEIETVMAESQEIVSLKPLYLRLGRLERGSEFRNLPDELIKLIIG